MDALTWFAAIVGVVAVLLAWVALARTIPVLLVEPHADGTWKVTNQGPPHLVVLEAFVLDEDMQHRPLGEFVPAEDYDFQSATGHLLPGPTDPWCEGRILVAQHPFLVEMVGVGRELTIKYRVRGFLGFLSRGTFVMTGGP